MEIKQYDIFKNGSNWLRADFHLHTNSAIEYNPKLDTNTFPELFTNKLLEQNIRIAAITNHNQLNLEEFKAIRKLAEKNEIYVLPGIEFSVEQGAKGIHILIIFSDSWIYNQENKNYIQDFIVGSFAGKSNYNNPPYPNSNHNFKQTIDALNKFQKDYFIVLAHVDDNNGLYDQIEGRHLEDFVRTPEFEKVLAFQKARKRDNKSKLKTILGAEFEIAEVEGTDNAQGGLDALGISNTENNITQNTFIKLGDYNFDALKFALKDHKNRTSKNIPIHASPFIVSVEIKNKFWDDEIIYLNAEMNNLIGIRGSGKSSLLEAIRYGLDINLNNAKDVADENEIEYKRKLVEHFLGSGGKITLNIKDNDNYYIIVRRLNEPAEIKRNGEILPFITVKSVMKCLYFGQKDLSYFGKKSTASALVNRLIGDKLSIKKTEINNSQNAIKQLLNQLATILKNLADENLFKQRKADVDNKLLDFKAQDLDKKLSKQSQFQKDNNFFNNVLSKQEEVIILLVEILELHKSTFSQFENYDSSENVEMVANTKANLTTFQNHFNQIEDIIKLLRTDKTSNETLQKAFTEQYDTLKEDFAETKRKINIPYLEPDTFLKLTNEADLISKQLNQIHILLKEKIKIELRLANEISKLRTLWEDEHAIVKNEVNRVNAIQNKIRLSAEYKQEKNEFKSFLKRMYAGSGIQDNKYEQIATIFNDLTEFVTNPISAREKLQTILTETQLGTFYSGFEQNKFELITYRVPDKFEVFYNDEPLENHSLGQKATALIIFILALKEYPLIMIDQPEDDLDNQTIYTQVIEELKKLKLQTQFIFATHNPNIPVLGDCEQIVACKEHNKKIEISSGSIDKKDIQENIIKIMEGGKKAFEIRKQKYEQWTPLLS